jgi:hypothetical protein
MAAKHFKDLSQRGRLGAFVLIAVSLGLVVAAQRDLRRRTAAQVRGSKRVWRLLCLNALGAASYLVWGRRAGQS